MARSTRSRLAEVRVRTATANDTRHGRQLFDGLGSNGLYLHVTPAAAKCRVTAASWTRFALPRQCWPPRRAGTMRSFVGACTRRSSRSSPDATPRF